MIWYTRDSSGDRALWSALPVKEEGDWFSSGCEKTLVASDWNGDGSVIDLVLGRGVHGLRKGGIAELYFMWRRKA